jgi:hypothetical protein
MESRMGSIIQGSDEINNMILNNKSINRVDYQLSTLADDQLYDQVWNPLWKQVDDQVDDQLSNSNLMDTVWDQLFMNLRK